MQYNDYMVIGVVKHEVMNEVVLHLVGHRYDHGHHLLRDEVPLMVLKTTQIEVVQLT
jgi:hypothetical protein